MIGKFPRDKRQAKRYHVEGDVKPKLEMSARRLKTESNISKKFSHPPILAFPGRGSSFACLEGIITFL